MHVVIRKSVCLPWFLLVATAACSEDSEPVQAAERPDAAAVGEGVTYHKDMRPIFDANCTGCHVDGGSGPFALDTWSAVEKVAPLTVPVVTSGYMPPWPASDECQDLRDVRALTKAERALFTAWQKNDFAEGNKDDYSAPKAAPPASRGAPDLVLGMPDAYTPDRAVADETRCFLTAEALKVETFATAMDIQPGVPAQVHHVQVHRIAAADIAAVQAVDARSEAPGYPCYEGGVYSVNMFSWRPGTDVVTFAKGDAVLLDAGSAIVLQVHYNTQFLPADKGTEPDRTSVAFWTLPEGERPEHVVVRYGHLGSVGPTDVIESGLIRSGETHVVGGSTISMTRASRVAGTYVQGELIGMTPHMHMLGTRLKETLKRADGSEACMVDVPEWDYHWQLDYYFDRTVSYGPSDTLALVCEYNNSAENQAFLDGKRVEPRNVIWGEGTFDEMCLNYVWLRYPRDDFFAAREAAAAAAAAARDADAGAP